jgi:hypothetical protein
MICVAGITRDAGLHFAQTRSRFGGDIASLARRYRLIDVSESAQRIFCSPARQPHKPRSDAARPLPRLTNALAEATCNGRDAVAHR